MTVTDVAERAPGYRMPAEIVDGNDVIAIYEAARRGLQHARDGAGPYLVECKTFRMSGHSAHDDASYVPSEIREHWSEKDPILRLQGYMIERGWAEESDFKKLQQEILQEIDEAVEWALEEPFPDPSTLEENVYG